WQHSLSALLTMGSAIILCGAAAPREREINRPMQSITLLLGQVRAGDTDAHSALFTQVYAELMRLARSRLAANAVRHLDAPSLVHEAYLRLSEQKLICLQDRREFFAYAAPVM